MITEWIHSSDFSNPPQIEEELITPSNFYHQLPAYQTEASVNQHNQLSQTTLSENLLAVPTDGLSGSTYEVEGESFSDENEDHSVQMVNQAEDLPSPQVVNFGPFINANCA